MENIRSHLLRLRIVNLSGQARMVRESETLYLNGDVGTKSLRQLQAEEDEEERYLKKAVLQSLDVYQGGSNMLSSLRTPLEVNNDGVLFDVTIESRSSTGVAIFGTGLQNEVGEYNCFLNVIIQSLWNLELFRVEFLRSSTLEHHHVIALSNLYPDSNFFQEAQMNDASEVLAVIFDCLHRSFAQSSNVSDTESADSNNTAVDWSPGI